MISLYLSQQENSMILIAVLFAFSMSAQIQSPPISNNLLPSLHLRPPQAPITMQDAWYLQTVGLESFE